MFKVNNKDARCPSGVFIVNSEYISLLFLVFLLLNYSMYLFAWRRPVNDHFLVFLGT